jgi:hypothetical protein
VEDPILHEAHVAGRRLQERQLVDERTFEHGSADSDGAALPLTVELHVLLGGDGRPSGYDGCGASQRLRSLLKRQLATHR